MCFNDGELRAWLDSQLDQSKMIAIDNHLIICNQCQQRSQLLRSRAQSLIDHFTVLSTEDRLEQPSFINPHIALSQFKQRQQRLPITTTPSKLTIHYWSILVARLTRGWRIDFSLPALLIAGMVILLFFTISTISLQLLRPIDNVAEIKTADSLHRQSIIKEQPDKQINISKAELLISPPILTRAKYRSSKKINRLTATKIDRFTQPMVGEFKQRLMENGKRYLTNRLGYQTSSVDQIRLPLEAALIPDLAELTIDQANFDIQLKRLTLSPRLDNRIALGMKDSDLLNRTVSWRWHE